ncbi:hypothetical protein RhiLY_10506 [Ceratobasidium sp. AG-Ba]|nr:hypothetical protein RhiLY_10506 [Ceratobasidium sp. AG-Ba]
MSKVVRLSNLKFAERWTNDPTARSGGDLRFAEQESAEPRRIDTLAPLVRSNETPQEEPQPPVAQKFKFGDELKDKLSKDSPGSELAHDATVWRIYLDEADEYDQELVKGRHASLDVLLLFAALFSAILTTFLVESKNLLQADPADTSVALLLMIAQNQGVNNAPSVEIPPFTPSRSALWINGLWFAALGLSLAAALITMLSKEWLTAYTASRPRPAHSHALIRQARLDGLDNWWALHIIALLPTLLHLALLLFALGLVVYLWTLEVVVAAVTGVVIALTLVFYFATTILGAIFPFCPFVTEISGYVRRFGGARLGSWLRINQSIRSSQPHTSQDHYSTTTLEDMRAVTWLAEHARDPTAADCAYQALAGIRIPGDIRTRRPGSKKPTGSWHYALNRIFPTLLTRFGTILREGRDLSASRGANAARYSRALAELATFLGTEDAAATQADKKPFWFTNPTRPRLDSFSFPSFSDSTPLLPTRQRAELALETLDGVWRDENPAFSADTFACLTGTELRLTALVADSHEQAHSPQLSPPGTPTLGLLESANAIELNTTGTRSPPSSVSLSSLRMTYARSLVRASVQLRYHSDGRTPIGPFALAYLLDAMRTGAKCLGLNPEMSAPHGAMPENVALNSDPGLLSPSYRPRSSPESAKLEAQPNFIIPVFSFEHYLRPTDLARGPLGSVVRVLGTINPKATGNVARLSSQKASTWHVRMAGARALAALAPVILKRWAAIKIPKSGPDPNAPQNEFPTLDLDNWPEVDPNQDAARLEGAIASQLRLIIRALGPHLLRAGAVNLIESVLAELDRIVITTPYSAYLALRTSAARDLVPILNFASDGPTEGHAKLSSSAKAHIVNILTFEVGGKQHPGRTHLAPSHMPQLLRLLCDVSGNEPIARAALKYIVDRVRNTHNNPDYLRIFAHTDQGYSTLVALGLTQEQYIENVVNSILQITHVAVVGGQNARHNPIILRAEATPGFLDAVSLVARHTVKMIDRQNHRHLHTFGRNMMNVLHRIDPSVAQTVLEHGALDEVIAGLQAQQTRSNSNLSGTGSASGSGTGRNSAPTTEHLLGQLRILKEQRLPGLSADHRNTRDNDRGDEGDATGQAI